MPHYYNFINEMVRDIFMKKINPKGLTGLSVDIAKVVNRSPDDPSLYEGGLRIVLSRHQVELMSIPLSPEKGGDEQYVDEESLLQAESAMCAFIEARTKWADCDHCHGKGGTFYFA